MVRFHARLCLHQTRKEKKEKASPYAGRKGLQIGFGPALTSALCVVCVLWASRLIEFVGRRHGGSAERRLSVGVALLKMYCGHAAGRARVHTDSCMAPRRMHLRENNTLKADDPFPNLCCRFIAATMRAVQPRRWRWFGSTPSFKSLERKQ